VWGVARPPEPGLLDLYNLLFEMGIRPDVQLAHRTAGNSYANLDEAIAQARQQLFMPADQHAHDQRIRDFLTGALSSDASGLTAPGDGPQYALVTWEH